MAEVKNTFIKSKMNKDLDARLVPNGEYRNAVNAQVSRSEGEGVGSLENVLGNYSVANIEPGVANLESIGYYVDEVNNFIYIFLTDNITGAWTKEGGGAGSNHFIYRVNPSTTTPTVTKLVEGAFLNFCKLNPIYGVNLLENLLFGTDNRNQPRQINVTDAFNNSSYYTTEDQISVAKYSPYEAIHLWKETSPVQTTAAYETTMKNVTTKFLPTGGTGQISLGGVGATWNLKTPINFPFYPNQPIPGQEVGVVNASGAIVPLTPPVTVSSYSAPNVTLSASVTLQTNDLLVFYPNPYYNPDYAGDSAFLEDKFVRFSYRFKFDNNEYSLVAPFTQACFIPKQDGYFLTTGFTDNDNDQTQVVSSSIVSFMENKVNSIGLQVPLPSKQNELISNFKVSEIDILYKESDGLSIKVVETIQASTLINTDEFFEYIYTGTKPFKTLSEKEITRVYDKVPVRAFAQESSGNRIIYSNFQNRHTPPLSLDYNIAATEKSSFNLLKGTATLSTPNGVVTAGTTITITAVQGVIQVGSIITSATAGTTIPSGTAVATAPTSTTITLDKNVTLAASSALVFNAPSNDQYTTSSIEYPNHTLKTNRSYQVGVVLSDKFGRTSDVILSSNTTNVDGFNGSSLYSPYIEEAQNPNSWRGNSLKVLFNQPIGPANSNASTFAPGIYNGDITSDNYNPLGWYSYKIVVQQKEQEYYNVYAPGAIKGALTGNGPATLNKNISNIVLINDNINKVPRDLSEVGPQDKTFASSVQLIGRVENTLLAENNIGNKQYFPERKTFTTNTIQPLFDAFDWPNSYLTGGIPEAIDNQVPIFAFYNAEANPFIAEITTSQITNDQFGLVNGSSANYVTSGNLAILETKPVTSLLDIYYETSTSGLVSDLNTAILNDLGISNSFKDFGTNQFNEIIASNTNIDSANFQLIDNFGTVLPVSDYSNFILESVFDQQNPAQDVSSYFELVGNLSVNSYNVKVTTDFVNNVYFGSNSLVRNFILTFKLTLTTGEVVEYIESISLSNTNPEMYRNPNQPPTNITPASLNVGSLSSPISTSTILITTIYGRNGAYTGATPNPNTREDLTWEITSVVDSQGRSAAGSTNFTLDITDDVSTPQVENCAVKNNLIPANSIPNDNYTLNINLSDAAGAIRNLVLNIFYSTIPSSLFERNYTIGGFDYGRFVEVQFSGLTSGNGFYIYTGTWTELVASIAFGNTILINNPTQNADSCPASASTTTNWYYGGSSASSESVARNKIVSCFPGTNLATGGDIAISNSSDYGWSVTL